MRKIAVLIPEDGKLAGLIAPIDVLNTCNDIAQRMGIPKPFDIVLLGQQHRNVHTGCQVSFSCDQTVDELDYADLILIPPIGELSNLEKYQDYIEFILRARSSGAEVASLCTGAFLLAATGLLNHRPAATHWVATDLLKQNFPKVDVQPDSIITDQDGIYTSGGASSSYNLLVYLIEKFINREVALHISKLYAVDLDRDNQAYFSIFQPLKRHSDQAILEAQEYIEKSFEEGSLSVEMVANKVAISKRNFIRRFKKATQRTPLQYIQRVRIEAAKRDLESTLKTIAEIMYGVGYNDPKTFRFVFRRYTGLTPNQYRAKFSRNLEPVL